MIPIKSQGEIERMQEGGKRLAWVMQRLLVQLKPGQKLVGIDRTANKLIEKRGGKPSFKMVPGYRWATCINVNQGVVHGIPNNYQLQSGDMVSLDLGMFYKGLHTDMAKTVMVKEPGSYNFSTPRSVSWRVTLGEQRVRKLKARRVREAEEFLTAGKRALRAAIRAARPGKRVGHLSLAIGKVIKKASFSPVEALTGHGVGKQLHEKPPIPCFLNSGIGETPALKPGMTLAIEVIYAQGEPEVVLNKDGWTVETADSSWGGLFEETVAVTKKGPMILTMAAVR